MFAEILVGLFAAPFGIAHAQSAPPVRPERRAGARRLGGRIELGRVIPILQAAGLKVTAVQNPLTSLADSVAATRRALALQDGPTVLVAHSWAGTVISEVGTDPKVTSLVYIAARAPDAGEDFVALSAKFPAGPRAPASRSTTASPNCPKTPS